MKSFLKILVAVLLFSYAVISFVAWDITTIAHWHIGGRFFYAVFVLLSSALIDGNQK